MKGTCVCVCLFLIHLLNTSFCHLHEQTLCHVMNRSGGVNSVFLHVQNYRVIFKFKPDSN